MNRNNRSNRRAKLDLTEEGHLPISHSIDLPRRKYQEQGIGMRELNQGKSAAVSQKESLLSELFQESI